MPHDRDDRILVLDVTSQDVARRRLWVRPGQIVHFGRTHRSDECFPNDPGMSSRHFLVEQTVDGWCCRDLKSTNGTFLNDALIAEAILHPGDRIRAGNTTFVVAPLFGSGGTRTESADVAVLSAPDRPGNLRAAKPGEFSYRAYPGFSGLQLFVGAAPNPDFALIAQTLAKTNPLLILTSSDEAAAHGRGAKQIPLNSNPDEPTENSRVLVQEPARDAVRALIQARWGRDELVCFAGVTQIESSVAAIRKLADDTKQIGADPSLQLRPSIFAEAILNHTTDSATLFAAMGCIYLEVFAGDRWGIIAPPSYEAKLQQMGFRPADPWR